MKKVIFACLFFLAGFSLFAQVIRNASIFVPPVTGVGRAEDNAFFYRHISSGVILFHYSLVRLPHICDFILKGTIVSINEDIESLIKGAPNLSLVERRGLRDYYSWSTNGTVIYGVTERYDPFAMPARPDILSVTSEYEYILILDLINNTTGDIRARQQLVYSVADDSIADLLSVMVFNMLAGIPDIEETHNWREKWLFAELSALWSPRIYFYQQQSINWLNFGLKTMLEYHFLNFLTFGTGLQFVQDWVQTSTGEYRDLILEIPFILKGVIKPAGQFLLEPYTGITINQSLLETTMPSRFSWIGGLQLCVKAGNGMITVDARFSRDLAKSVIPEREMYYDRNSIQIGIGYKYGFILKRNRRDY